MYSELKNLISLWLVLLLFTLFPTIFGCVLLIDIVRYGNRIEILSYIYLLASTPILLIMIIKSLNKIANILKVMDSDLSARIIELERKVERK